MGPHHEERWPGIVLGGPYGLIQGVQIVAVPDPVHVPAVGGESSNGDDSLAQVGLTVDGDAIVVVETDEIPELEMARK